MAQGIRLLDVLLGIYGSDQPHLRRQTLPRRRHCRHPRRLPRRLALRLACRMAMQEVHGKITHEVVARYNHRGIQHIDLQYFRG